MLCDGCDACYINGVFCHEHGCPNIKPPVTCFECGCEAQEGDKCCSDEGWDAYDD